MAKLEKTLELLRTLIVSTADNTVQIRKDTLYGIQTCLHNVQENIEFL